MNDRDSHPLFPPREDDDDFAEVVRIHITRSENGRFVYAPPVFEAAELQSLAEIFELYGGGHYELIAKDSRGKISDRRRYELPGAPKPLDGRAPEPERAAAPLPMPTVRTDSGIGALVPLLMGLAPLALEWMKSSAAAAQAQQANQTQFLLAMLNRDAENARAHVQTMQQLADRQQNSQTQLFQTLLERASSSDPAEVLMRGVEIASNLRAGAAEAGGANEEDTLRQVVEGIGAAVDVVKQVKTVADDGSPGPGMPPPQKPRPIAAPSPSPRPAQEPTPKAANQ